MSDGVDSTGAGEVLFDQRFLSQLERLHWITRRALSTRARGLQLKTMAGRSLEVLDYRGYRAGDDLRYLDWNAYARLQQLVIKVFAAEHSRDLHIALDLSASMAVGAPPKFDLARRLGAALAYVGLSHLEAVRLWSFGARPGPAFGPQRRRAGFAQLLDFLRDLQLEVPRSGATDLGTALSAATVQMRRPGLFVILSDLMQRDSLRSGLQALARRGHAVVVLQVLAVEDLAPALSGDLRLVDNEEGTHLDLFLDQSLRKRYAKVVQDFLDESAAACRESRADYLMTTTSTPFEQVVLGMMREGRLLR